MAKEKRKDERPEFRGFIEFKPRAEQRRAIKAAVFPATDLLLWLEKTALAQHKIGISHDAYHSAYVVSLQDKTPGSPNAGYVCTTRHSDLVVALSAVRYLLEQIGDNVGWDEYIGGSSGYDW